MPGQIGLLALIREDLRTQREGLLAQGFWALLVYRLSAPRLRRPRGPVRAICGAFAKIAGKLVEMYCGISLPETARIGRRLRIEHFGGIIIHGSSVIGDDCVIRHNVTLGNRRETRPLDAPVLGSRVHVGAGAVILGAIRIGNDCRIGANAVVLFDAPPGSALVGNPARIMAADELTGG